MSRREVQPPSRWTKCWTVTRGLVWHPKARETWDTWTERILAAEDPAVAEEMFRVVLPLYVAHPDDPTVRAKMEELGRDIVVDLTALKAWEAGLY